ncbi:hypothetical protein [Paenibacillus pinistramenti]|uniref:hypothetical protein n=1 Tax=Paenibacillus pinistramenti TaxID=1768003 RepID=UPI001396C596|nr:hypothetical protein [Paenibacillus pinistramenti]
MGNRSMNAASFSEKGACANRHGVSLLLVLLSLTNNKKKDKDLFFPLFRLEPGTKTSIKHLPPKRKGTPGIRPVIRELPDRRSGCGSRGGSNGAF